MRVQHVHALAPQQAVQRPPRPHLARRRPLQADHAHAWRRAGRRGRLRRAAWRPRRRSHGSPQRAVEALGIEPVVVWIARRSAPPVPSRSTSVTTAAFRRRRRGAMRRISCPSPRRPINHDEHDDRTPRAARATPPLPSRRCFSERSASGLLRARTRSERAVRARRVRGYYIDLRVKAEAPTWPHHRWAGLEDRLWVRVAPVGTGRATSATSPARARVAAQRDGRRPVRASSTAGAAGADGLWVNRLPYTKTFQLPAGWPSAMAQGEGASLLGAAALGDRRGALRRRRAARRHRDAAAVVGRRRPGPLDGAPWPEEYPTDPPPTC